LGFSGVGMFFLRVFAGPGGGLAKNPGKKKKQTGHRPKACCHGGEKGKNNPVLAFILADFRFKNL